MFSIKDSKRINRGPFYVLITGILFSFGGICFKLLPWNAVSISSFRSITACLVLLVYAKISGHRIRFNKTIARGAAAVCLTLTLYAIAVKMTTAGAAIVIQFTVPIWTMIFGLIMYHKKPRGGDILSCIAVLAGIAICFYEGLAAGRTLGNLLALLSGITYSGVFMSNSSEDGDPLSSMTFGLIAAALIGLPHLIRAPWNLLDMKSWMILLFLGFIQMGLAYVLFSKGLETTDPLVACLLSGLEPVLYPIWVALFYNEPITPLFALGGSIVLISITAYQIWNMKHDNAVV